MVSFIQRHMDKVIGMVNGWDRLRFRGTVRMLANVAGLGRFLRYTGRYLFKDFGKHAEELSQQTRAASLAVAERAGREVKYLLDPGVDKEAEARQIQERDGIKEGLICVLAATEPCWSFNIKSNKAAGKLELVRAYRKCQHLYHYYQHPEFGRMHVRLQTWLPFNLWVNINGREWLARQMDRAGMAYERRENCFAWVSDVEKAQGLLDEQTRFNFQEGLGALAREVNPAFEGIRGDCRIGYYWSIDESEWSTDMMFRREEELTALFQGRLVHHAMESLSCTDVLRFMGERVRVDGQPYERFEREVFSNLKARPEGVRLRHQVGSNSLKMYNKQQTVLRTETTLNNMRELKSPRMKEDPKTHQKKVVWERMRKGVADIARRAEVSQQANQRYLEAMAAVECTVPLKTLTESLAKAVVKGQRRARGLNLLGAADARLLQIVGDGKFLLHGLRNKDLQAAYFGEGAATEKEKRRRSGQMTRKLWLLRAHGLIRKVSGTHRYLLTDLGRQVITALQAAREADVTKLAQAA